MSIHSRIKERRLALGMTSHQALADRVGVSWQTVQLWEKEGGTAPNRKRIEKVAEVLGVTPAWLHEGIGSPSRTALREDEDNQPGVPLMGGESGAAKPAPPIWMDGDAYKLLNLFYDMDDDGRRIAMAIIEDMAGARRRDRGVNEG